MTPKTPEESFICIMAFRYALGRRTSAPAIAVRFLTKVWDSIIPIDRQLIHWEIQEAIRKGWAGGDCDVDEWEKLLDLKVKEAE